MANIFAGKKIIVGVTGSIAAFKVAGWVSSLSKEEADVTVIMTASAQKFVGPLTFAAVSGNKVYTTMFSDEDEDSMAHISLGREADLILIAPATANSIAKLAHGLAENLLETTVLASRAEIIICPAMNSRMYTHQATQENLKILKERGYTIISPDSGMMACKEEGQGRLPEWSSVEDYVARGLSLQDLKGRKFLISAGPTRESIDPARFLSNRSSGKMGYALARAAFRRGAEVTLVAGPTHLSNPEGVKVIHVESASEMYDTIMPLADSCDVIIKAAAVADYRPAVTYSHKVKKGSIDSTLQLQSNKDILLALGSKKKKNQVLVGFAAESQNLLEEGRKKLDAKNLDFIAVNDIRGENTGFESETNQIYLLDKSGEVALPFTSKLHSADLILDRIEKHLGSI